LLPENFFWIQKHFCIADFEKLDPPPIGGGGVWHRFIAAARHVSPSEIIFYFSKILKSLCLCNLQKISLYYQLQKSVKEKN
jgi:hypothetical protein